MIKETDIIIAPIKTADILSFNYSKSKVSIDIWEVLEVSTPSALAQFKSARVNNVKYNIAKTIQLAIDEPIHINDLIVLALYRVSNDTLTFERLYYTKTNEDSINLTGLFNKQRINKLKSFKNEILLLSIPVVSIFKILALYGDNKNNNTKTEYYYTSSLRTTISSIGILLFSLGILWYLVFGFDATTITDSPFYNNAISSFFTDDIALPFFKFAIYPISCILLTSTIFSVLNYLVFRKQYHNICYIINQLSNNTNDLHKNFTTSAKEIYSDYNLKQSNKLTKPNICKSRKHAKPAKRMKDKIIFGISCSGISRAFTGKDQDSFNSTIQTRFRHDKSKPSKPYLNPIGIDIKGGDKAAKYYCLKQVKGIIRKEYYNKSAKMHSAIKSWSKLKNRLNSEANYHKIK